MSAAAGLSLLLAFGRREASIDLAVTLAFAALYGHCWRQVLPSTARDLAKRQTCAGPNGFDIDAGSQLWSEAVSVRAVFAELTA